MTINMIDLFCGCGGLTEGFLFSGGYKTLAGVDWERVPVMTLRQRLKEKWGYKGTDNILHFDIQNVAALLEGFNGQGYAAHVGLKRLVDDRPVDVIVGGPPCQAYSVAGRVRDPNGMRDDYRNFLFESYIKVLEVFRPKFFIFENVQGILSAKPGGVPIIDRITQAFTDVGYLVSKDLRSDALFDMSDFGIPQKRKRVIIFGVDKHNYPLSTVGEFYKSLRTYASTGIFPARLALDGLPKFIPRSHSDAHSRLSHKKINLCDEDIPNHNPRFHNARDIRIFKMLAEDIQSGRNEYVTAQSLIELYKKETGRNTNFHKYHVIRRDAPSNTIPAHLYKDGLRHIHPDPIQARTITVREAARLQTFDDDFAFLGSKSDQYKMIGNAVPPKFAFLIAECIKKLIT